MTDIRLARRFRALALKRIAAERSLSVDALTVVDVQIFPLNRWGHIGTIEVTYNAAGHHALYGFSSVAIVQCYAD